MEFLFFIISMVICFGMGVFATTRHYRSIIKNIGDSIMSLDLYIENGFSCNWEGYSRAEYLDKLEQVYYYIESE